MAILAGFTDPGSKPCLIEDMIAATSSERPWKIVGFDGARMVKSSLRFFRREHCVMMGSLLRGSHIGAQAGAGQFLVLSNS